MDAPCHGTYGPDQTVGFVAADINGSGHSDVMTGGYSRGPRDVDGEVTVEDPLGRLAWFENPGRPEVEWTRHDISRRKRGMFGKFVPLDMDGDGDVDFVSTRGNSEVFDGVFWSDVGWLIPRRAGTMGLATPLIRTVGRGETTGS